MDGVSTGKKQWAVGIDHSKHFQEKHESLAPYTGGNLPRYGYYAFSVFLDGEMVELTPELKGLFDSWVNLTQEQKTAAAQLLKTMSHDH